MPISTPPAFFFFLTSEVYGSEGLGLGEGRACWSGQRVGALSCGLHALEATLGRALQTQSCVRSCQAGEGVLRVLLQEGGSLPFPLLSLLRRVSCNSSGLEFTA